MKKLFILLIVPLLFTTQMSSQTTLPYFQNFETGVFPPTDWGIAHGGSGITDWELSPIGVAANSSNYSILFNNMGAAVTFYVIRCAPLDLRNTIEPVVSFDIAYARYDSNNSDTLSFWFTTNTNGTTGWTRVFDQTTSQNVSYSGTVLDTAPPQTTFFTPTNAQWETKIVDLSGYIGQEYIRFAFESVPNSGDSNVIYIDNVHFYDSSPLALANEEESKFRLYPNPSTGKIQMNTSIQNLKKNNFKIITILGKSLNNFTVNKNTSGYQLNLDSFKKGIYFITISTTDHSETKKIIIQ